MANFSQIIMFIISALALVFALPQMFPEMTKWTIFARVLFIICGIVVLVFIFLFTKWFKFLRNTVPKITKIVMTFTSHPLAKIVYLFAIFSYVIYLTKFNYIIFILIFIAFIISLSSIKWFPLKKNKFVDTFNDNLSSWNIITGSPTVNSKFGKPAPCLDLSVMQGVKTNCFLELLTTETPEKGEIECDVFLEPDSLFNIVFGGDLPSEKWYMARLDSRTGDRDKDAFLKNNGLQWDFLNASNENSTASIWHKMKIEIDGKKAKLFKNGNLVAEISDCDFDGRKIGLFNEVGEVYVDNFSVKKIS